VWTYASRGGCGSRSGSPGPRPRPGSARQCGCEGFPLALRLQALLEKATGERWHIFDKDLIERLVQEEHIPRQLLQTLEDPARYLEAFGFHPRGAVTSDEAERHSVEEIAAAILAYVQSGWQPGR